MPTPPRQPMFKLSVGGASGSPPSEDASIASQYIETSVCGDGIIRVSIHIYLDRNGGEVIPPRPIISNGVPQYEKGPDHLPLRGRDGKPVPALWPASRLLGETSIKDSLQTVLLPLGPPSSPLVPVHIGGFARVTLAARPSLEEALAYYDKRDAAFPLNASSRSEDPPFIPSHASLPYRSLNASHNPPRPSPRSNL